MTDPLNPKIKTLVGFALGVLVLLVLLAITAPVPLAPHFPHYPQEAAHG